MINHDGAKDSTNRSIIVAVGAVIAITVVSISLSLVVPFEVDQPVTALIISGDAEHLIPGQLPVVLTTDDTPSIKTNESLRALPGSAAQINFESFGGRAVLQGPATVKIIESHRRATALGHAIDSDQFERKETITLEQTQGTVRYFFSTIKSINVTIRLPDSNYTPESPCWSVSVTPSNQTAAMAIDCQPQ